MEGVHAGKSGGLERSCSDSLLLAEATTAGSPSTSPTGRLPQPTEGRTLINTKRDTPLAKQYGLTPPITTVGPTEDDIKITQNLEQVLRRYNLYENHEQRAKREEVLQKLNLIVSGWVREVYIRKGVPEHIAKESGARLFTFGSYRLGVNPPGSDIDTLCVIPWNVDRRDFFESLFSILQNQIEVTNLTAVTDAYVPLMKLYFEGVQIDLLCSRLAYLAIPADFDLLDPNNLKNIDDQSIRSLNGCRVADQIMRLVPSVTNFRTTLICVKKWAQARRVYSNIMGFFGGIAWALLTARICQLYPNSIPSTIVSKFFGIYSQWKWPSPVLLTAVEEGGPLSQKVWNPRLNHKDKAHLMPVITPAYPSMNSTHNVSESTKRILLKEFKRASKITLDIDSNLKSWDDLFEPFKFWSKFKHYLRIDCLAKEEGQFRKWVGFVESRVRLLILKLEKSSTVEYVRPHPEGVKYKDEKYPHSTAFFLGLKFDTVKTKANGPVVNLSSAVTDFKRAINDWRDKTSSMEIGVNCIKQSELPDFVFGDEGRTLFSKKTKKRKLNAKAPKAAKRTRTNSSPASTKLVGSLPVPTVVESFNENEVWVRTPTHSTPSTPSPSAPSTPPSPSTPPEQSSNGFFVPTPIHPSTALSTSQHLQSHKLGKTSPSHAFPATAPSDIATTHPTDSQAVDSPNMVPHENTNPSPIEDNSPLFNSVLLPAVTNFNINSLSSTPYQPSTAISNSKLPTTYTPLPKPILTDPQPQLQWNLPPPSPHGTPAFEYHT